MLTLHRFTAMEDLQVKHKATQKHTIVGSRMLDIVTHGFPADGTD